ncbi:MAG: DUF29 domain-containing protein [Acetobacteraceae bacterium]
MSDDLYERDILTWAERQADLLRRMAHGERLNETVDWPHVIEEVQDVGLSELRACESLLRQALVHLLKLRAFPDGSAAHWRSEAIGFLADAQARFTPSMRQRIGLDGLYAKALRQVRAGENPPRLPETCPFELDELLADDVDVGALIARLG